MREKNKTLSELEGEREGESALWPSEDKLANRLLALNCPELQLNI